MSASRYRWSLSFYALAALLLQTTSFAEAPVTRPNGAPGGGPPTAMQRWTPNPAMEKAMAECMKEKGIKPPPPLTTAQRTALQQCAQQAKNNPQAFHECIMKSGSGQPMPSEADRKGMAECRNKVFGGKLPTPPPPPPAQH
jgi:hypothetical protein